MKFFSLDNPIWRAILRIGQIWWLNILWVVTSIPIVTIGASTTALIYSCMKLRKEDGYPTANFFHSFKDNFKQSTVIWLLYAAVGGLLLWGLIFWNQTDNSALKPGWALCIALLIPYSLSLLYVFAVQSKFVNTIKNTIHYSFILSIKHFKITIQMVLMMAVLIYLNVTTIVWVNFLTIVVGIGLVAYLFSMYYDKVFAHYIPAEPEEEELMEEAGEGAAAERQEEVKLPGEGEYGEIQEKAQK